MCSKIEALENCRKISSRCRENNLLTLLCSKDKAVGLLICTLISEYQGLEKLRSVSNLRKFSGSASQSRSQTKEKNPSMQYLKFF